MMLNIIKNILSGDQYPLLKTNCIEGHVFRQFLQDTPSVNPEFTPAYRVNFLHMENHPYKVRFYFRLITNDIYTTLNQFFEQYKEKSALQIQYHHQNFKLAIEEYIVCFNEKIQIQDISGNLLKEPPSRLDEQQMFVIIAYYAIASLACAYFQYLDQFSMSLPHEDMPESPNDFIYDTLQAPFPKEIEITCTKRQSANEPHIQEEKKNSEPIPIVQKTDKEISQMFNTHPTQDSTLWTNKDVRIKKLKEVYDTLTSTLGNDFTGCSQWFYVYKLMAERGIYSNRKYQQFKSDLEAAKVPEEELPNISTLSRKYDQIRQGSTYPWKPKNEHCRSDIIEEGNEIAKIAKQVLDL